MFRAFYPMLPRDNALYSSAWQEIFLSVVLRRNVRLQSDELLTVFLPSTEVLSAHINNHISFPVIKGEKRWGFTVFP